MDIDLIDFNAYDNPEDIKDYEAFIGPDGKYYKVKTRYESCDNCTHYTWAMGYFKKHNLDYLLADNAISLKCKTPLEVLINYLGFVRYTHAYSSSSKVYLTIPNRHYFNYIMSKEQIDSIYGLMEYNNDKIDSNIIDIIEESHNYEVMDNLYEKLVHKSR